MLRADALAKQAVQAVANGLTWCNAGCCGWKHRQTQRKESRMASLGTEFAMLLLVSGNWHALAKLETELKRLAETSSLSIHLNRTEPRAARTDMLPYSIDVVCLDQTGIVSGLSGFFSSRGIDIAEVSTRSYPAAHTGAPMFSVQMIINVSSRHPFA